MEFHKENIERFKNSVDQQLAETTPMQEMRAGVEELKKAHQFQLETRDETIRSLKNELNRANIMIMNERTTKEAYLNIIREILKAQREALESTRGS